MKMPAKKPRLIVTLSSLLLLGACVSSIEVTHHPISQETRIPELKTYCWAEENSQGTMGSISPTGGHHSFFDATVRHGINEALADKGYRPSPCETADFMIDYRIGIHTDIASADAASTDVGAEDSIHDYGAKWTFGKQADIHYEGLAQPEETLITVQHGTLHIAAFSTATGVLWHSSAEKLLNELDSDTERLKTIKKAVEKTMKYFPSQN